MTKHETAARAAGWTIGTFGAYAVRKWWNPKNDDGSRYCADNPRSVRYICEDHGIVVAP